MVKSPAQLDREIAASLTPKKGEYTKLATAPTLPVLEKLINTFWYSTTYRVDPTTLQITSALRAPPEKFFVMPWRGGYLFGRRL